MTPDVARRVWTVAVALALLAVPNAMAQSVAQTYFVPIPEEHVFSWAGSIDDGTFPPSDEIHTVISLSIVFDNTILWWDHWEDGFETDIANPDPAGTTEIWGDMTAANGAPPGCGADACDLLSSGDTVFSESDIFANPRDPAVFFYDGMDKFAVSDPIAVSRAAWPVTTGGVPGVVLAGAVAVFDTQSWGSAYTVPAGEDIGSNDMFEYTAASILAEEDGTLVSVDLNADGDFIDPGELLDVPINQGETLLVEDLLTGSLIQASSPVQVDLLTGDEAPPFFEARWYELVPSASWSDSYYNPVGTTVVTDEAVVLLFNPETVPLDIDVTTLLGTSTVTVPAGGISEFTMPANSGAQFDSNGTPFFALTTVDFDDTTHDWGFSLIPESALTPTVIVGWAPGSLDLSQNLSPIWVTPLADADIYVDYDGDPSTGTMGPDPNGNFFDVLIPALRLDSIMVSDPNDNDQTGMRIYTVDGTKLSAAWGQDPATGVTGSPALDLGTGVLPFSSIIASKGGTLVGDFNGNGRLDPGEVLEYSIVVTNSGIVPLTNTTILDTLDPNVAYLSDTTRVDGVQVADDLAGLTLFPIDETGLNIGTVFVGQTVIVTFQVSVDDPLPPGVTSVTNSATIDAGLEAFVAATSNTVFLPGIDSTKSSDAGGLPVQPGQILTYTIDLENTGNVPLTDVEVIDALPAGTSYVAESTTVVGQEVSTGSFADDFDAAGGGNTGYGGDDGTLAWAGPWQEINEDGDPNTGDEQVLFDIDDFSVRVRDNDGGGEGVERTADLSAFTTATLDFDYRRQGLDNGNDWVEIQISSSGPGGPFTTLDRFDGAVIGTDPNYVATSYDITPHLSAVTTIRFLSSPTNGGGDTVFFDNVTIDAVGSTPSTKDNVPAGANPDLVDGVPPNLVLAADNFGLLPGDTMTITYQVLVDFPIDPNITQLINSAQISTAEVPDAGVAVAVDPVSPGASVGDLVWLDVDGDGVLDIGEPGLPNALVELRDGTCTPSVDCFSMVTGADGMYRFDGLPPGTYEVFVDETTLPAGLILAPGSSNPSGAIVLGVEEQRLDVDFGYTSPPGTALIGDRVWSDADADGLQDPGEPGITGVTVNLLDAATAALVATTTTVPSGFYLFAAVAPGEYVVEIDAANFNPGAVLDGYTVTAGPHSQGADTSRPFTVGAGGVAIDVDFGYENPALFAISDSLWFDDNADGLRDAGEGGLAGVTVDLLDAGSNVIATTTTDANGDLAFPGVPDGSYTLSVSDTAGVLSGFTGTSAAAQAGQLAVVVAGADVAGDSFGYNAPGRIGDLVFSDADGDGVLDAGELGIGGVTIDLLNTLTSTVVATTTTAADGSYLFANVDPGAYNVIITDTGGVLAGFTATGDPDEPGLCMICNGLGATTLSLGTGDLDQDFGYQNPTLSGISGTVFEDLDADGVLEAGELGIAGVTVDLLDAGGSVVATAVSDGAGAYSFPGVPDGDYSVRVTDQAAVLDGYTLTSALDEVPVTVSGSDVTGVDFGYVREPLTASIAGSVWYDIDADGVRQGSESGLSGVTVELLDAMAMVIATTTTDANGNYVFPGLPAGTYSVSVDTLTLPAGLVSTTGGDVTAPITLSEGETFNGADLGYATPAGTVALGDSVFADADGDGIQGIGEVGIGGVTVNLRDSMGMLLAAAMTASDGSYLFVGFAPAEYTVEVDPAALPPNYDTTPTNGLISRDFDLSGGGNLLHADFGFAPTAATGSIGDTVYLDNDGDGMQDVGEPGLVDVTIDLVDSMGNLVATAITDTNGNYAFTGIADGDYTLVVTDINQVLNGLNPTEVPAMPIAVAGLPVDADFGYAPSAGTGSIGGTVWHDSNQTLDVGVLDAGESGLQSVTVELWLDVDNDGVITPGIDNLVRTTATDVNGDYAFLGVSAGDYLVTVTDDFGVLAGMTSAIGPNPGQDGNGQTDPYAVTLVGGAADFTADFAYEALVAQSIFGTVFFDVNADGLINGADQGVGGVRVFLFRDLTAFVPLGPAQPQVGQTTTDANGDYSFLNMPEGSYLITVDPTGTFLAGTTQTTQTATGGVQPVTLAGGVDVFAQDFGFNILATAVLISRFEAYADGGDVVVEWETAYEAGTAGFYLYRYLPEVDDWAQVNDELLPAAIGASQGAVYRFADPGARPSKRLVYALVEVEAHGERTYGPFQVDTDEAGGRLRERLVERYEARGREVPENVRERFRRAKRALAERTLEAHGTLRRGAAGRSSSPAAGPTSAAVKIAVGEDGLYFVSSAELATVTGLPVERIEIALANGRMKLENRGQPVSWQRAGDGSGLYFYGEGIDSLYTAENVYRLGVGDRQRAGVDAGGSPAPVAGQWFRDQIAIEEDLFAATLVTTDPDSDFWFWEYLSAGDPKNGLRSFPIDLADVALSGGEATLELALYGATDTPAAVDHHAVVRLNGVEIGETTWDGTVEHRVELAFSQSLLVGGENTLEVEALLDGEAPYSIFYVDGFDLGYDRLYRALGDRLSFTADGHEVVTVAGFVDSRVVVLNVDAPEHPRVVRSVTHDALDGHRVSFVPASPTSSYLAVGVGAVSTPAAVWLDQPSNLTDDPDGADYLVIAPAELLEAAEELAVYRTASGLSARVVDLEDVYDEFNFGLPSPWAIRDLLAHAVASWPTPPSYVVLAGKGTYDYKDHSGLGDNLVPTVLATTPYGLYASDQRLADLTGDDGVPDVALGRIPVLTAAELSAYVDKVAAYEAGTVALDVLLLADDGDTAGDFPADSEAVAARLPSDLTSDRVYLSELEIDEARSELFTTADAGVSWINYIGHGGLDRFADEGLLLTSDTPDLAAASVAPVLTALTCTIARFEIPGFASLGESLVVEPSAGAVAVFAPSGLSLNFEAVLLNQVFAEAAFAGDGAVRVGDAVRGALEEYAVDSNFRFILDIYNLLGDPAVELSTGTR